MAKISPVSIKYIIHAQFEAEGVVEKPDIIGAIFGQTEGLLGEDLEMRELQKSGKIGRIEVSLHHENGKTKGEIEVPSALDKAETSVIAAALETIERIGPSDTKITVTEIEDVRKSKRDYILERAKKLMEEIGKEHEDFSFLTQKIKELTRTSKIQSYGVENLPCGDVSGDEIIIVEGRADVLNLLRNGIKNVIAMNGTKLPKTLKELTKNKERVILFVDGDRGGQLIIKNVIENAKVDYIATAPTGKEVEELTGKEILQALRKKVSVGEYLKKMKVPKIISKNSKKERTIKKLSEEEKEVIREKIEDLVGTKGALIFNKDLEIIKKVPLSELSSVRLNEEPYVIAINGLATKKIIKISEKLGCHNLVASNFVDVETKINLVSL